MNKPILIGLGYRARSGKDTVANYLEENHSFGTRAFAAALKQITGLIVNSDPWDPDFKESMTLLGITGGQALQQIGVKLREIDKEIWIKTMDLGSAISREKRIVVTDVRFENEAAEIRRLGGVLVEVWRPGLPEDDHVSEQEGRRIKWDYVLVNSGTLDELYSRVDAMLAWIQDGTQCKLQRT